MKKTTIGRFVFSFEDCAREYSAQTEYQLFTMAANEVRLQRLDVDEDSFINMCEALVGVVTITTLRKFMKNIND